MLPNLTKRHSLNFSNHSILIISRLLVPNELVSDYKTNSGIAIRLSVLIGALLRYAETAEELHRSV